MPRKTMSLQAIYDELLQVSPYVGWETLLKLLRWQLDQGYEVGFSFGFYARKIILSNRQCQAKDRERVANLRGKHAPLPIAAILSTGRKEE